MSVFYCYTGKKLHIKEYNALYLSLMTYEYEYEGYWMYKWPNNSGGIPQLFPVYFQQAVLMKNTSLSNQ
jgi:hypothetical protein